MTLLAALLASASAFFACLGAWPAERQRLVNGWAAARLRHWVRSGAQRARLRSMG